MQTENRIEPTIEKNVNRARNFIEDEVQPKANNLRARVRDSLVQATDRVKERAQHVDARVHESPWQFLGIAALAGLTAGAVTGFLMGHRRR